MALLVPLGCGAMAALLIWTRYWPPLPGLLAGWLGWCVLAALLPLATRRNAALAATGALVGMPVLALTVAMNFRVVRVEGASMSPTFLPGDVLLIDPQRAARPISPIPATRFTCSTYPTKNITRW